MKYENYRYLYPPRPKNAIPPSELKGYDNNILFAQPKLNGSNCVIFTNGTECHMMNRHYQRMSNFKISKNEIISTFKPNGKWIVLNGEYMNKSKRDERNELFNHKFVLFDCLVIDNKYLVGKTFKQRVDIIEKFNDIGSNIEHLDRLSENIYRVRTYNEHFTELFEKLIEVDMMEGLVLKRKRARLETGYNELNNTKTQLKCRKPTKNYHF